jgi:hypothetical protein
MGIGKLITMLSGGSLVVAAILIIVVFLLIKPALILLALHWIGVSVVWANVWVWLGAIILSVLTD